MKLPVRSFSVMLFVTTLAWAIAGCVPVPPTPVLVAPDGSLVEAPPPPSDLDEVQADKLLAEAQTLRRQNKSDQAERVEKGLVDQWPGERCRSSSF